MAGYLVEITRDFDGDITNEDIRHYVSNNTAKPRGAEFIYIESEIFEFPEITSPLGDEDGIVIANDAGLQATRDALVGEAENLVTDILAINAATLTIDGGDQDDIRKLLRLVQILLAEKAL